MKKTLVRFIFFLFAIMILNSYGSTVKIDSLKAEIFKCEVDSIKAQLYYDLGRQYEYFKSKERIGYFTDAAKLAKNSNYTSGILKFYPSLITNLYHRNMNDVAMGYGVEYIQYLEKYNKEEDLLKFYNLYANLLCKQKKYKVARYHYDKAFNYYKSQNNYLQCANIFNNISILLINTEQFDSALVYNSLSSEIYRVNNDNSAYANSLLGFAEIMIKKGNLESALQKANEAFELYQTLENDLGLANTLLVLGEIYFLKNDFKIALMNYENSLKFAEKLNFLSIKRDIYLGISKSYNGLLKYKNAYQYQMLYKLVDDSISSELLEGKLMEMEVKYDISKKENMLKENEYQLQLKEKQRKQLLLVIFGGLLVLVFLVVAYRQKGKSNKIISEQKRLVDEKQKDIMDSIRYAKRIQHSLLPTEKYIDKNLKRLMK